MPRKPVISILHVGVGNIRSVTNAFTHLGWETELVRTSHDVTRAAALVLPGVGSFPAAMRSLAAHDLDTPIRDYLRSNRLTLGICLGMELLADWGAEDGGCEGLGAVSGSIERFSDPNLRVPHVGFNTVQLDESSPLFAGLGEARDFYFTHSYRLATSSDSTGVCDYGGGFVAAVQRGNILGVQFHPEKSQRNGLQLLKNFAEMARSAC